MERAVSGFVNPTKETFALFKQMDREGPLHMLNMIRLNERAVYPNGQEVSGLEAYRTYAREAGPIFLGLGGRHFWVGRPELMLIGPSNEKWDIVFIAEYPGVDAFVQMLRDPTYRVAVKHRTAAVADSRLLRLEPGAPGNHFGEFA